MSGHPGGPSSDRARRIVDVMNDLLAHDPVATASLVNLRVPCTGALAEHPTCQVGPRNGGGYEVGLLGILNALAGKHESGWGYVAAVLADDGSGTVERFILLDPNGKRVE